MGENIPLRCSQAPNASGTPHGAHKLLLWSRRLCPVVKGATPAPVAAKRHFPVGCLDDFVSTPHNLRFFFLSKSKHAFALQAACLPSGVCREGKEKAERLDAQPAPFRGWSCF